MNEIVQDADFRTAVSELHRYLGDELAPMMVTDSVGVLMEHPPALVVSQIHDWIDSQYSRGGAKHSASDYIYHALKKLHLLCEFNLIDAKRLREYLEELAGQLLAYCPDGERDKLRQQLSRLAESEATLTATPVEQIYQAGGGGPNAAAPGSTASGGPGAAGDEAMNQGLRRFSLLLERLGRNESVAVHGQTDPQMEQIQMQALVTAAVQARSEAELQGHLRLLGGAGLDSRPEQVFRMLGRSLPAWNVPLVPIGPLAAGGAYQNRPMEAMRKMVDLAETPEEWARRFNDLVQVAIEQFNDGSLARATTMLDLAERMATGKNRYLDVVTAIRRRAHEAIKEEQLRKYAERTEERPVLLRFMNFFSAMTPEGILRQLHEERTRERRWLLLLLLETHGVAARTAALQELEAFQRGDKTEANGYHQRNLVYLLRRIPAGEAGPSEKEMETLNRLSKLDQPAILIREALRTIGPIAHPLAERILATRLREYEAAALGQAPSTDGKPNPILELLDAACSGLSLQHTAGSLNGVIQHGLREEPSLGDTLARLDGLGAQDFSAWPQPVERLIKTIRDRLPKKILGLVIQKRSSLPHLIRALAGTPLPAVRSLLEEIAIKYSTQDLGSEAAKALEGLKAATPRPDQVAPGLSGDIGLFGLPNLFQSFSDSRVTGILTLRNEHGRGCGTVRFREGKIASCEHAHLKGEDALYQLFEKPETGKFAFQGQAVMIAEGSAGNLIEVVPMLMEAMRRHDELQQARAMVPDTAHLKLTGTKPTRLEEEEDLKLTQLVWNKTVAGSTPDQSESEVPADSYRIRRLLAHWVESGVLQVGASAASTA